MAISSIDPFSSTHLILFRVVWSLCWFSAIIGQQAGYTLSSSQGHIEKNNLSHTNSNLEHNVVTIYSNKHVFGLLEETRVATWRKPMYAQGEYIPLTGRLLLCQMDHQEAHQSILL